MGSLRGRAHTMLDWMRENLDDEDVETLCRHGAAAGVPGLTYYSETTDLYARFSGEIWDELASYAAGFGVSPLQLLASLDGQSVVETETHLKNLLVWRHAEMLACSMLEEAA